jgi:3-deoxy-D-manno-octulosonic-acid transferase
MAGPTFKTGELGPPPPAVPQPVDGYEIGAYRLLTRLARPAAPYILRLRERNGKEDPLRKNERLGRPSLPRPSGTVVWIHAASVGETSSILPLIRALHHNRPAAGILLTTGTVTSARFAATRIEPSTLHQYVPLDEPSFVASFLDHWRPDLAIFTEQEIWPNLVLEAARRRIPLALVNARMSDRSFERWRRRPRLANALFSRFSKVLTQSDTLEARFRALGAVKVENVGNLKIDTPPPPVDAGAFAALHDTLGGRPRVVAASTHDPEELAIADAHSRLRTSMPGLVTIIAPRHPDRGEAIATALRARGICVARRSEGELPSRETEVYLVDTIGELGTMYALAPVAFIGGTLIPHGGQNPIEAVQLGSVVVAGQSRYNFADVFAALDAANGCVTVEPGADLAAALLGPLTDPVMAAERRSSATAALTGLSGALERSVNGLLPYIAEDLAARPENMSA